MADHRAVTIQDMPAHLIVDVLSSGRLGLADLVCFEATCRLFRTGNGVPFNEFRSTAECAAFQLCAASPMFTPLPADGRRSLLERCGGSWKKVLRFFQSVEEFSGMTDTSAGNMQVCAGRYHTFLIRDSAVYSCGSSSCGVLGHGEDITECAFRPIDFPSLSHVVNVSASQNHAAFVTQSGEVFTCGDNSSSCCGHGDIDAVIFRPTRVEALKDVDCKQVATGLSFTVILTRDGQVYTWGSNMYGQLGHGDTTNRPTPTKVELFDELTHVSQIAAGGSYTFALADEGTVYSFGSCTNLCLGHEDQHNELLPRAIQSFKTRGIHILLVSAGDEHAAAIDSNGYVYTWGRGYCGALGHGDETDKAVPELVNSLKGHVAVQVCARRRKTFVLADEGSVFAFGWMGFGSLGFSDMGSSDKVMEPRTLHGLKPQFISQITTGLYHTMAVSKRGAVLCFGDNERKQLGHATITSFLKPTEIAVPRNTAGPSE